MQKVTFYTTLDCSLCDQAYRFLTDLIGDISLEIDVIDISHAHNSDLIAQYGQRIPVIVRENAQTELEWPFTKEELKAYLST